MNIPADIVSTNKFERNDVPRKNSLLTVDNKLPPPSLTIMRYFFLLEVSFLINNCNLFPS